MSRDEFRRRCAAVRAGTPVAEIRQVLAILGIARDRNRLAADLHRRGFTPGYLAAWALDRL